MTPENIVWKSFLGEAPQRPFDANRYANWRFFWDYSGGNVYENMCHQLSFWYKAMGLSIPKSVTMTGGLYLWKDGREVPDTMNVAMEHDEMLFTWDSGFGNERLGVTEEVLGDNGTISHTMQGIRYTPEKKTRPDGNEMAGLTRADPKAHMQNFLDAIRDSGTQPNCPFDIGFRVSIACRMAVESYRQQRTMHWDAPHELIEQWTSSTRRNRSSSASRFANSPKRKSGRTSWSGTKARSSPWRSSASSASWATWAPSFPRSWAAPAWDTSSIPSSSRSFRAWMARWALSWRPTRRSAPITFTRWAATSSAAATCPSAAATCPSSRPASGSAAGRSPSPKPAPTPPAPAPRPFCRMARGCSRAPRRSPPTRTMPMSAWPWRSPTAPPRSTASRPSSSKRLRPDFARVKRKISSACAPAPPAR
ncbi:hypothetical protein SBA4_4020001 [Candidatus Sulfopaludibacter sp. SbA4]|nr:hypothetical protein SBA4_4020001 [Candidatus Sulfopaludibacter sp. SbA4]